MRLKRVISTSVAFALAFLLIFFGRALSFSVFFLLVLLLMGASVWAALEAIEEIRSKSGGAKVDSDVNP